MEDKSLLELRGHHLGIVYNILAEFRLKTWTRKDVEKSLLEGTRTVLYPRYTLQVAYGVPYGCFWRLFFGKSRILMVEGLDLICKSGCIQWREKPSENKLIDKKIDKDTRKICINKSAKIDLLMLEIFDYKIGQIILGEEIVKKAGMLVNKFPKIKSWPELIDFHKKTPK